MPPKPLNFFGKEYDDDDDSQQKKNNPFKVDKAYSKRLLHNKKREDLQRHEELVKRGLIPEKNEDSSSPSSSEDDEASQADKHFKNFVDVLIKVKKNDPSIRNKEVKFFESDEEDEVDNKKDQKKEKKKKETMYLKDVQARQLLEDGPEFDEGTTRIRSYAEEQKELRQAVVDATEVGDSDSDGEDFLRVKEKKEDGVDDDVDEDVEEIAKKMDEFFGDEAEVSENQFLKEYMVKKMWKDKDGNGVDEEDVLDDWMYVEDAEDFEAQYRHEENAGEVVLGQSRIVEGSVRKKDNVRKAKRKAKEDRLKMVEMERKEELKRLKNVKKKEIKEKMKKVLSVAGFKDGEECSLDANKLDGEFDPEEYDKMMKAAFDDKYYGADDSDLDSDDDCEKPDFDKEDELLGFPKDWDVTKGGDGFIAAREKVLKQKENGSGDDAEEDEEEEEEEEEVDEEKEAEGKRKRKRKTSLVQKAKEAMMEEYYKLDYEDTIGDLKTRFRYAKVQPNKYALDTAEVLFLGDTELNQYVPLKKMAPYSEKDWEVNKHKVKEQKLKNLELWQNIGKRDDKKSKKRKNSDVAETKPTQKEDEEGEEAAEKKLSRKSKRRRRQAEKKLPPNRMAAYGKA